MAEPKVPGPYRAADGSHVPIAEARDEWARAAYVALVETARSEDGLTTAGVLAEETQTVTGIRTLVKLPNWIGHVLALVAEMCVRNFEPQLPALCVKQGSHDVGDGYVYYYELIGEEAPKNVQRAAEEERERCYEYYADNDGLGWDPTKLKRPASNRQSVRATATEEKPPDLCPACFIQLPSTGQCDNCD